MPTVVLGIAPESNAALSANPIKSVLFQFPQQFVFNAFSILRPHWKIYFFDPGTENTRNVHSDGSLSTTHASPVVLDRVAQLPSIYIEKAREYAISVRDEFGIERHKIDYFLYPHTTAKLVAVGVAAETDDALTITPERSASLGIATETDTAMAITPVKAVQMGIATETDTALGISVSIPPHALTPVELETDFYGYCTGDSAIGTSLPAGGTLTPGTIKGADIILIGTQNASIFYVEIAGDLAQDFFDSIETTQFGTLDTDSVFFFNVDTINTPQAVTQWVWEVGEDFNNLGVERDATFSY